MGQFQGFAILEQAFVIDALIRSAGGTTPKNPDTGGGPTYRVYGPTGLMNNGTGTASKKDTGTVTGASNASPIVITSNGHGLSTGTTVTIAGVGGNTNANGDWPITVVDANTFSLNGSTGNSAYTGGGTWNTTGLFTFTITPHSSDGYASGNTYSVLVTATVSGVQVADLHTFTVS